MKRNNEREELLADLLAEDEQLRTATLEAGLDEMRRICKRRRAMRMGAIAGMAVIVFAMFVFAQRFLSSREKATDAPPSVARVEEVIPGTSIRVLDDEQLLDFFRDRPVALVGGPGNQQLLLLDERN